MQSGPDWKGARATGLWLCCVFAALGFAWSSADDPDVTPVRDAHSSSRVYKFTSDTSHYFSTSHEGKFVSNTNYLYKPNLENLPWHLGAWKGWNLHSDDSNILYQRYYEHEQSGAGIYLVAVHGTNESRFHTPEVCYIGDGWKIEARRYQSLELRGETFQVRYAIARKEKNAHLVLYWYLWPDSRRNIMDGLVMLRLSVKMDSSLEDAEQAAIDFIRQLSDLKLDLNKKEVAEVFSPVLPQVDPDQKRTRTKWTPYKEKALAWLKSESCRIKSSAACSACSREESILTDRRSMTRPSMILRRESGHRYQYNTRWACCPFLAMAYRT